MEKDIEVTKIEELKDLSKIPVRTPFDKTSKVVCTRCGGETKQSSNKMLPESLFTSKLLGKPGKLEFYFMSYRCIDCDYEIMILEKEED